MKRIILLICLIVAILLLSSCEPLFTIYGEIVHNAVREHYESYEILSLIQVQKDGKRTFYYFCVIDDSHDHFDVLWLSTFKDENDDYTMVGTVNADDIEFGKVYSATSTEKDLTVEYLLCKKKDIPDSTLQKEKLKFSGEDLYFCITSISTSPVE